MEKAWFLVSIEYGPNGKVIMAPIYIPLWLIASMEKAWFYKRFFFKVVMVMVKDKRKYNKKMQIQ